MAPAKTVMDLVSTLLLSRVDSQSSLQSLAQALFFASRGIGTVRHPGIDQAEAYTSTARVILSGLGADELLGGYIRHKNAFKHAGWQGLLDEVRWPSSD